MTTPQTVTNWTGIRLDIPPHISDPRSWICGWFDAAATAYVWESARYRSMAIRANPSVVVATYVEVRTQWRGEFTDYTFDQVEQMARVGS